MYFGKFQLFMNKPPLCKKIHWKTNYLDFVSHNLINQKIILMCVLMITFQGIRYRKTKRNRIAFINIKETLLINIKQKLFSNSFIFFFLLTPCLRNYHTSFFSKSLSKYLIFGKHTKWTSGSLNALYHSCPFLNSSYLNHKFCILFLCRV